MTTNMKAANCVDGLLRRSLGGAEDSCGFHPYDKDAQSVSLTARAFRYDLINDSVFSIFPALITLSPYSYLDCPTLHADDEARCRMHRAIDKSYIHNHSYTFHLLRTDRVMDVGNIASLAHAASSVVRSTCIIRNSTRRRWPSELPSPLELSRPKICEGTREGEPSLHNVPRALLLQELIRRSIAPLVPLGSGILWLSGELSPAPAYEPTVDFAVF